jgi:surfeit locus 1 family protein
MTSRVLLATLMTAVMLPVLLALGAWQWQRMGWKAALLEKVAQADQSAPRPYAFEPNTTAFGFPDRVMVRGTFDHAKVQKVWVATPDGRTQRIVTPLVLAGDFRGNGCGQTPMIFIDRGTKRSDSLAEAQPPQGEVAIVGRLLNSETSLFVASGGQNGLWTLIDIEAMGKAITPEPHDCVPDADVIIFAPHYLEAETASAADAPQPQKRAITLSNRHFEYALTWWSFAIVLAVVYLVFLRASRAQRRVLE